jgi:Ca-activated chloride channel family protein
MHPLRITDCLLLLALFAHMRGIGSQTYAAAAQNAAPYSLSVSVDEVILTFHAADRHGLPVNDLKLDELSLFDNGKPQHKILAFQSLQDRPIRAGILMDKSESMEQDLPGNRAISTKYIQRLLRQQTDQAFIMDFADRSQIAQSWTSDPIALAAGLRNFVNVGSRTQGTAIFDAIYRACLNQFGHIDHVSSGNFILLFSDGEDNAGLTSLQQAIDECQRTNTVIYAFRAEPKSSFSSGPKTLVELTSETGGRVFRDDESEAAIDSDLQIIEADLRNQYRLIYRPAELKHDGSFHRIALTAVERVDNIAVRSGYYAPRH